MFLDWICKGNRKCFLLICPLSLSTGSYFHPPLSLFTRSLDMFASHCRDSVSPLPYLSTFTFTRLLESSDWIYLHRVTWERFAERVFPPLLSLSFHLGSISQVAKCPLYPISTSASWVNTLSDPFLCLLKLTFDIIWNPPSYIFRQENPQRLNWIWFMWFEIRWGQKLYTCRWKNKCLACVGQLLVH